MICREVLPSSAVIISFANSLKTRKAFVPISNYQRKMRQPERKTGWGGGEERLTLAIDIHHQIHFLIYNLLF